MLSKEKEIKKMMESIKKIKKIKRKTRTKRRKKEIKKILKIKISSKTFLNLKPYFQELTFHQSLKLLTKVHNFSFLLV